MIRSFYLTISLAILFTFPLRSQHQDSNAENGLMQSPIEIDEKLCSPGIHILKMNYDQSKEHIDHKEHTIELQYDPGSFIEFDGIIYEFKQFHFHTPSEHHLNGDDYPLEMHMVHWSESEEHFLVLAMMFEEGKADEFIDQFLSDVPEDRIHIDYPNKYIDINKELLPENFDSFFYYEGSLTTPPFSENVSWVVDSRIHSSSAQQIELFKSLEGINNRVIQKMNNRPIEKIYLNEKTQSN